MIRLNVKLSDQQAVMLNSIIVAARASANQELKTDITKTRRTRLMATKRLDKVIGSVVREKLAKKREK